MTIEGNHTAGELSDLLRSKDYSIKALKQARASFVWPDAAAGVDWDTDMAAFEKRYDSAATKARAAIIGAYATGPLGANVISLEGYYQDVLHALTRITGQIQKGDFQELDSRFAIASGHEPDFSKMPQPTAVDADLNAFKSVDSVIRIGEKTFPPAAVVGLGMIVGVVAVGVTLSVIAPQLLPHRR